MLFDREKSDKSQKIHLTSSSLQEAPDNAWCLPKSTWQDVLPGFHGRRRFSQRSYRHSSSSDNSSSSYVMSVTARIMRVRLAFPAGLFCWSTCWLGTFPCAFVDSLWRSIEAFDRSRPPGREVHAGKGRAAATAYYGTCCANTFSVGARDACCCCCSCLQITCCSCCVFLLSSCSPTENQ